MTASRVDALIARLDLAPHPEGGHYRQVYKSTDHVQPGDDRALRAALTTIYFLLAAGEHSRWHRVRSDEVWHFYEGDPLELLVMNAAMTELSTVRLAGSDDGVRVHVVPSGCWQAARPQGAYSLVGCTVAPGFEFEDFDFLSDVDPLRRLRPDLITMA